MAEYGDEYGARGGVAAADDWVMPIPASGTPAYAVMPWALFRRLRALAAGRAVPPGEADIGGAGMGDVESSFDIRVEDRPPMSAGFERVVPFAGAVDAADRPTYGAADFAADDFGDNPDDDAMPLDMLERLLDGEHPLKAFRRYRGLTQKELAARTGLNATYLSQLETRKRGGSTRVYRRLAAALGVDIGDLIE